jgi:hypothetical protein
MKINRKTYIPDKETFDTNQSGQLTGLQKSKIGKIIQSKYEIRNPVDQFVFHEKDGFYNFKMNHVNFYSSTHPFIGQNASFLPGVQYELHLLKTFNQESIFLSAKAIQSASNEDIYVNMVSALTSRLNFSSYDLYENKNKRLSQKQLKKLRKFISEYDPDPTIGTFDFIFNGSKTIEQFSGTEPYLENLIPYFQDTANIFFMNVKYRIFYEEINHSLLSIEPVEIIETDHYQPNLEALMSERAAPAKLIPEKLYTQKKPKKKFGCSIVFPILCIVALYLLRPHFPAQVSIPAIAIALVIFWLVIIIFERN